MNQNNSYTICVLQFFSSYSSFCATVTNTIFTYRLCVQNSTVVYSACSSGRADDAQLDSGGHRCLPLRAAHALEPSDIHQSSARPMALAVRRVRASARERSTRLRAPLRSRRGVRWAQTRRTSSGRKQDSPFRQWLEPGVLRAFWRLAKRENDWWVIHPISNNTQPNRQWTCHQHTFSELRCRRYRSDVGDRDGTVAGSLSSAVRDPLSRTSTFRRPVWRTCHHSPRIVIFMKLLIIMKLFVEKIDLI